MLLMLALSALAAAAVGSVVVYQRGAQRRLGAPDGTARLPPKGVPGEARPEATLENLAPGDVVIDGNDDFVVAGSVIYSEERDTWRLHVLDGGAQRRFLDVRKRSGATQAALLELVQDAPLFGALGNGLTYRGAPMTLDARGDARVAVQGEVEPRTPLLKYARYVGAGGALLLVEEEGAVRRALFGHAVPPSSLQIYPGELNRSAP